MGFYGVGYPYNLRFTDGRLAAILRPDTNIPTNLLQVNNVAHPDIMASGLVDLRLIY